jgi:hypothetical protein
LGPARLCGDANDATKPTYSFRDLVHTASNYLKMRRDPKREVMIVSDFSLALQARQNWNCIGGALLG